MPQFFTLPKPPTVPNQPLPAGPPNRPLGQDWLSDAVDAILGGIGVNNPLAPEASKATQLGGMIGAAVPIAGMAGAAMRGASAVGPTVQAAKALETAAPAMEVAPEVTQGITAYHGSPHDFDQFSLAKIGTGEGAQAYGHGLYFAENTRIAKGYRERLSQFGDASEMPENMATSVLLDGKVVNGKTPSNQLTPLERAALSKHYAGGQQQAIQELEDSLKYLEPGSPAHAQDSETIHALKNNDLAGRVQPFTGRTYEVNINANPEHFLDWDKPLGQQSEHVQQAVRKAATATPYEIVEASSSTPQRPNFLIKVHGQTVGASNTREQAMQNAKDMFSEYVDPANKGGEIYRQMSYAPTGPGGETLQAPAAKVLREAGIPGVKYLDAGSRQSPVTYDVGAPRSDFGPYSHFTSQADAEKHLADLRKYGFHDAEIKQTVHPQTSNYVVFDDSIINILKKYGIALPFAGAGAAAAMQPRSPGGQ